MTGIFSGDSQPTAARERERDRLTEKAKQTERKGAVYSHTSRWEL